MRFAEELERNPKVVQKKQWASPLPCHPRSRRRPVTVITAGLSQSGSRSRIEGMQKTATILKGLVTDVSRYNPLGILLIASNPVDVLTYAAWKWSGLRASQVIGSGTSPDPARFRRRLAERYGVASSNVHAYIVGVHGDSQIPVPPSARTAGVPLEGFVSNWDCPTRRTRWERSPVKRVPPASKSSAPREQPATG